MDINARTLGYRDQRLIRPGDVVQLGVPTLAADSTGASDRRSAPDVCARRCRLGAAGARRSSDVLSICRRWSTSLPTTPLSTPVATPTAVSVEPAVATVAAVVDQWSNNGVPVKRGLAAAVLLSGGAIAALEARRRQQLRSAHVGCASRRPDRPSNRDRAVDAVIDPS